LLLTDLREIKSFLEIEPNDTSEDKKLNFYIEMVSQWIGEILNRPDFSYQFRTQIISGSGTQRILLRFRPVYPMIGTPQQLTVTVDEGAYFGCASGSFTSNPGVQPLTYGVDYCLEIDQVDGSSRSGVLWRLNDYWPRPFAREIGILSPFAVPDTGSIQVQYMGGWTCDTLPAVFRLAINMAVAKLRSFFPLGIPLGSESYEERSVSYIIEKKNYIINDLRPLIWSWRNWKF